MLVEFQNVNKNFINPETGGSLQILKNISIDLEENESIAIIGPSGSGKTTLLNVLGALDKPTSGKVVLSGRNLAGLNDEELSKIRSSEIGFVFQLHHLLPQCTVIENVLLPVLALEKSGATAKSRQRAEDLLNRVGLKDRLHFFPAQLSGGELQRVAVVRALINNPKLILADEPTGALDETTSKKLSDLLIRLQEEEKFAMVLVTHSIQLAERMRKVYTLSDGELKNANEK